MGERKNIIQHIFAPAHLWAIVLSLFAFLASLYFEPLDKLFSSYDQEVLELAYNLRAEFPDLDSAPTVLVKVDESFIQRGQPSGSTITPESPLFIELNSGVTPRGEIANILAFFNDQSAATHPAAILLDLDIAWRDTPAEERLLASVLEQWAANPQAPQLLLARQYFDRLSAEGTTPMLVLPSTPYDEIVASADNIEFVQVRVQRNSSAEAESFTESACATRPDGSAVFLPAAAIRLAMEASGNDDAIARASRSLERQRRQCERPSADQPGKTEDRSTSFEGLSRDIFFHLKYDRSGVATFQAVSNTWATSSGCPVSLPLMNIVDSDTLTQTSATVNRGLFCGAIVAIGADSTISRDYINTPYGEAPGATIQLNAARGLLTVGTIVRPSYYQYMAIGTQIVCIVILLFMLLSLFRISTLYKRRLSGAVVDFWNDRNLFLKVLFSFLMLIDFLASPAGIIIVVGFVGWIIGGLITAFTMNFGYIAVISSPLFAMSLWELYWDYKNED